MLKLWANGWVDTPSKTPGDIVEWLKTTPMDDTDADADRDGEGEPALMLTCVHSASCVVARPAQQ